MMMELSSVSRILTNTLALLVLITAGVQAFAQNFQIYDSPDIRIFWQEKGAPNADEQQAWVKRVTTLVRPKLEKVMEWSRGQYGAKYLLPINIVLIKGVSINEAYAYYRNFSYINLDGQKEVHPDFAYVTIGLTLNSDEDIGISHTLMHEIGHIYSRFANNGILSSESYADFFSMIFHDNDPNFDPTYRLNDSQRSNFKSTEVWDWKKKIAKDSMRNFAEDYEYANSFRFSQDGHFISPVINSALHRLAKIVPHQILFREVTDSIFNTTLGFGPSANAWMDRIIKSLSLDVPKDKLDDFKRYLKNQGWRDPEPSKFRPTLVGFDSGFRTLIVQASDELLNDLESTNKTLTITLYTRSKYDRLYPDWEPQYSKSGPMTRTLWGDGWDLTFKFGDACLANQRNQFCHALPVRNAEFAVSLSYVDHDGIVRQTPIAGLQNVPNNPENTIFVGDW